MNQPHPCQVVRLTPIGRGAVATVLVQGDGASELIAPFFQSASNRQLGRIPLGQIALGRWLGGERGAGEDVVLCRRDEARIEIHCHGGRAAAAAIVRSLVEAGCRETLWEAYVRQSEPDPIAAAARIELAEARTDRAAAILMDQYRGALRREIDECVALLAADAPEEAVGRLRQLDAYSNVGLHLTRPWRVVLAGPPNAGKSSLINALVGYRRAIAHPTPGTTFDVLTTTVALEGWPVELADTAGLRTGGGDVERLGVDRAREQIAASDLTVLVFDGSERFTEEHAALFSEVHDALVAHNKSDLPASDVPDRPTGIATCALDGNGLNELILAIVQRLVPHEPPPGAAVPFTQQQARAVHSALADIGQGRAADAAGRLRNLADSHPA